MTTILKGKKALLLAEACKIDKEMKDKKKRLEAIKEELKLKKGSYENEANDTLNIGESDKMSPIEPRKAFLWMKKNNLRSEFWKCVKIQLTELRKQVPEKVVDKWERKVGTSQRWTFK